MNNTSIKILSSIIHMQPEMKSNKEVTVSLTNVIIKKNNCSSIISAQKAR